MATFCHAIEAEGEVREKKEKEEKEQEKAEVGESTGEKAPKSPGITTPLSQRGKARGEGPVEVKLELHPLQNRWALWFFKNDRSRAWQDNLHLVTKFDTVEDFWAMYSHIQLASKLSPGCDYALFKDGIEPMWEDSRNKRGGRWLVSLAKQQRHIAMSDWGELRGAQQGGVWSCHQHPYQGGQDRCVDKGGRGPGQRVAHWACVQRAPGPLCEDRHWVPGPH
ncbi:eukaryotic translation initiation factor 4E type 1B isoform X3 [Heterocephalus glaber]|uniref:Eukaryotic translation initiation factor 4E type 1B isoform X3 n=1 Tax=Heterocephalus glaber TaxID=10181 RepID=A0AAX6RDE6_HETGA|nr:eukaryotic translation initiation factor 4E type 1B isoform X3 [Heterocephalus glaber]